VDESFTPNSLPVSDAWFLSSGIGREGRLEGVCYWEAGKQVGGERNGIRERVSETVLERKNPYFGV